MIGPCSKCYCAEHFDKREDRGEVKFSIRVSTKDSLKTQ